MTVKSYIIIIIIGRDFLDLQVNNLLDIDDFSGILTPLDVET